MLHNAVAREDGSWVWRYQRPRLPRVAAIRSSATSGRRSRLPRVPLMLVRGMAAGSVVDDADEAELRRRVPNVRVEHVEGSGHSVQGDAPLELAALHRRLHGLIAPGHGSSATGAPVSPM